jgi:hypothetical protein
VLLVVALALVTPAAGPSRGNAHDFVSVHLIFPHHHDAQTGHGAAGDDLALAGLVDAFDEPSFSAAGPLADAASLASKGLAMAVVAFVLAQRLRRLDGGLHASLPRQRWDAVPTRPPR